MSESLREQWRHFIARPSGRRFQMRYRQRREKPSGTWRKIVLMSLGTGLVLLGIVMIVLPGPGLLAILVGAALIAQESLVASRVLDRIDLWLARVQQRWRAWRVAKDTRRS